MVARLARGLALLLACITPGVAAERVISLAPSLTEMMLDLQAGDRLVGRLQGGPQRVQLPQVPELGMAGQLDLEQVLLLQPDLVLYWPGSVGPRTLRQLERSGIEVFHASATTMQELAQQYAALGARLGLEQAGERIAGDISQRLEVLEQRHAGLTPLPLFYQLWDKPMYTLGGRQIVSDALRYCGARNIFDDLELPAPQVDIEKVVARQPQLLLVGRATLADSWPVALRPPVLVVPDEGLVRPSLQMLDALEQLCAAIDELRSN